MCFRESPCQICQDGDVFREYRVIYGKRRHFSMRIDLQIGVALVLTLRQIDKLSLIRCPDFFKDNMWDHRGCAWPIVEHQHRCLRSTVAEQPIVGQPKSSGNGSNRSPRRSGYGPKLTVRRKCSDTSGVEEKPTS